MNSATRRWALLVVGFAVSALFVYLTLAKVDLKELRAVLGTVSVPILSLAIVTRGLGFVFVTARAQILLKPLHEYGWGRQLKSILLGFVGNNLLPFRLGELLRVGYLARWGGVPAGSIFAVAALERLLDTFTLMMMFLSLLPLMVADVAPGVGVYVMAGLLVVGVVVVLLASRWPQPFVTLARVTTAPLGRRVSGFFVLQAQRFAEGLAGMRSPVAVAGAFAMTLGYWASSIAGIVVFLWAFGMQVPWFTSVLVMVFVAFGTLLPSAPAFVGTYDYFAARALALVHIGPTVAASFALVMHTVAFLPWTLFAIPVVYLDLVAGWRGSRRASQPETFPFTGEM